MACPLCQRDVWEPFLHASDMYTGAVHTIVRCTHCGLARTAGLSSTSTGDWYVYGDSSDAGARFGPLQWLLQAFRRARVRGYVGRRSGRVLDVGCGDGSFLQGLAECGWDVAGTELSEPIAATAKRRLGDRIRVGPLERVGFSDASFDLVTFWHVLEHLDDPAAALAEARRLVKPGGTVLVAVPNLDSLQARLFKQTWLHLDLPRHRWHFSATTLAALAERCRLHPMRVRHFSLEYGPAGIVQGVATTLGLGHALFTRLVRMSPGQLLTQPLFWLHLPLVILAIIPSLALELSAALAGRGGAIVMELTPVK